MGEVLHEAFMPMNLIFTVMLLMVVIYWIMVILGALDTDFLDIDFTELVARTFFRTHQISSPQSFNKQDVRPLNFDSF